MKDYQIELIDRYFQREMLPEELEGFRRELSADPELREAFNLRRLAGAALRQADVQAFRREYSATLTPVAAAPEVKIRRLSPYAWALAAGVALLLGFLLWQKLAEPRVETEQLFALYDVPELYPQASLVVNEGMLHKGILLPQSLDELKTKGLQAYDSKDWDAAIRFLNEYLDSAKPSGEETPDEINLMNLYVGRAWLEKSETEKAIAALKKAEAGITDLDSYGLFRELIRWQLALAHLKNNDPAAARKVVESLLQAEQDNIRQQANQLIKALK